MRLKRKTTPAPKHADHTKRVDYKGYRIDLVSYYNPDQDGWVPAARMSRRDGTTRFFFTHTGEPLIYSTKELADSRALEWGKDWIDDR